MTRKQTTTAEFSAQYKDPRWQKKRLEILERDKFTCQKCGDKESTLHVHHCKYDKGCKVWEYQQCDLITMCDDCHKDVHKDMDTIKWLIAGLICNYRFKDCPTIKDALNVLTPLYVSTLDDPYVENVLLAAKLHLHSSTELQEAYGEVK